MSRQIELLDKFYDNKATESEKRQLAGLLNDPDRWTDDFDKIWDHSFGHMPDSTDERIFKAITATANPTKINIRKFFMRMVTCAAVFGAVAISLFYWNENRLLTKYNDMTVEVGHGQKSDISLPDGTIVYLNADSKLRYGSHFNGKQRQVELTGEAYFDVAKDAQSPFIVKAGDIQVRALGTSFNVHAYPDDENITTYLAEGSVIVSSPDQSLHLSPGEVAVYSLADTRMTKKQEEDDRLFIAWMNNEMVFNDEPILNIIKLLERNYNVKFEIKSDKLNSITFTGTLKNASLQSTLYALQFTSSVSYKKKEDVIELYSD
ncbi:FecR family protein [Parabacteroides goldsteinii]|uniref:FecR family protein n=1 Tax=Parabacteroides goldsteinii TaxID=328812 RepID=UPI003AB2F2B1